MAPSTLDLFILTFNCAKNLINVSIFASHLYGALTQNATGLPDVVVFSLQEVAPISYAFIGSYFLNPYYARFGDALNLASTRVLEQSPSVDDAESSPVGPAAAGSREGVRPYTLVRAKNVGMTAILLYARDPARITQIEEAECGFGAADMGNKGAVGLRVTWSGAGQQQASGVDSVESSVANKTTELTFVAAHLAAMEWNLKKRNSNWRSIVAGLTFANPRSVLPPGVFPSSRSAAPTPDRSGAGDVAPRLPTGDSPDPSEEEDEQQQQGQQEEEEEEEEPLLPNQNHQPPTNTPSPSSPSASLPFSPADLASLHALSIYRPTAHLFVAGDLNYRISATAPPPGAAFPSLDDADRGSERHYRPAFLARDQLTLERRAGRALHGLSEADVAFPPTYKYDVLPSSPPSGPAPRDGAGTGKGAGGGGDDAAAAAADNEAAVREGRTVNGVREVAWRLARHRWPGWCDRVLWWDVPRWAVAAGSRGGGGGHGKGKEEEEEEEEEEERRSTGGIEVKAYDAMPVVKTSDHRAVFWRAEVPVLAPEVMRPPPGVAADSQEEEELSEAERLRLRLPVPVDVHAWERRAAARRKEMLVGWSALIWCTKEGAVLLATALALGVGSWWFLRG